MDVRRYDSSMRPRWDEFVRTAKNGSFLFLRDYLEYHSDRFEDASLLVFQGDKLLAVLPAEKKGKVIRSHYGLTYGGMVYDPAIAFEPAVECFSAALTFLRKQGAKTLLYRKIPPYYASLPVGEDEWALFRAGAHIEEVRPSAVINFENRLAVGGMRDRAVRKAETAGCEVRRSSDYRRYWREVLEVALSERHGATPVHTADEIVRLAEKFPDNIQLFVTLSGDKMLSGAVIYRWKSTAHLQYVAATPEGRSARSTDVLFRELIDGKHFDYRYFSLGTSQIPETNEINHTLLEWKESWGARAVSHFTYRVELNEG